jgi:hypothetical protein
MRGELCLLLVHPFPLGSDCWLPLALSLFAATTNCTGNTMLLPFMLIIALIRNEGRNIAKFEEENRNGPTFKGNISGYEVETKCISNIF